MESTSSQLLQKRRPKRKRTQKDPELERLDSLKWNSSIPSDDPLSAFIGSNELEGGFLSLEEIDEAEYGLAIPEPETVKQKLMPKAGKKSRKDEHNNGGSCGDASGDGDDSSKKEMGHDENMQTGKKGKKEKKKRRKRRRSSMKPQQARNLKLKI